MERSAVKDIIEELLAPTDIQINGDRPWDIQVHNTDLYQRVINEWSLGLGEAYMEGWWTAGWLGRLDATAAQGKRRRE